MLGATVHRTYRTLAPTELHPQVKGTLQRLQLFSQLVAQANLACDALWSISASHRMQNGQTAGRAEAPCCFQQWKRVFRPRDDWTACCSGQTGHLSVLFDSLTG